MASTSLQAPGHMSAGSVFQDAKGRFITIGATGFVSLDLAVYSLAELLNAGFTLASKAGPTSGRPTTTCPGLVWFDTSLGIPVRRNSRDTAWMGACGEVV
jgi:hypothetical protein